MGNVADDLHGQLSSLIKKHCTAVAVVGLKLSIQFENRTLRAAKWCICQINETG